MNHLIQSGPEKLETYFEELLAPQEANQGSSALPSLAKYAIVLEGEHVNIALLLENFGGIADPKQKSQEPSLSVDALAHQQPKFDFHPDSLRVKIQGFPVSLACKRVETIIDLHQSQLAFHYDDSKPWSAGVIKSHWAILLDITRLPQP